MNSPLPTDTRFSESTTKSKSPDPLRIIRAHFPPDHLMSQDEIAKCHNYINYNRKLTDVDRHRIQGHMEHVERFGLMMDITVPESELNAWSWTEPYLRREVANG
jgi:hypothetical protein